MTHKVILSPAARRDLILIGDYLEAQAGRRIAKAWATKLRERALSLAIDPECGPKDEHLGAEWRRLIESPYLILYRVEGRVVTISRVLHGARDLPSLFPHFNSD